MGTRTTPPFRADHVGSLLRPPELLRARADLAAGAIGADALRDAEDEAIRGAVALQRDVGLRSATDGEFRRTSWHMDFIYALGGIEPTDEELTVRFHNEQGDVEFQARGLHIADRIRLERTIFGEDFAFLRSVVERAGEGAGEGVTPKQTIPSPSMVHYRGGPKAIDRAVYPDQDAYWHDLAQAYAAEVRGLYDLGCRYLQLDDTSFAYLNDPKQREMIRGRGEDPDELLRRSIATINAALAGRPDDLTVTTHMCRGNFRSSWAAEGGYDTVAETLLNDLDVDAFFLEFDDERSGSFAPLRHLPPHKLVVLGLVTTKSGTLEDRDDVKRRLDDAARHVDLDRVCLSPQCGFSSTVEGNAVTVDDQVAKLRLVVDVAGEVWG